MNQFKTIAIKTFSGFFTLVYFVVQCSLLSSSNDAWAWEMNASAAPKPAAPAAAAPAAKSDPAAAPTAKAGSAPQASEEKTDGGIQLEVVTQAVQNANNYEKDAQTFNAGCGGTVSGNRANNLVENGYIAETAAQETKDGKPWDCTGTLGQMAGSFKKNGDARVANHAACADFKKVDGQCKWVEKVAEQTKQQKASNPQLQTQMVSHSECQKVPATNADAIQANGAHLANQQKNYDVSTGLMKCAAIGGLVGGAALLVANMMKKKPDSKEEEDKDSDGEPKTAGAVLPITYTGGQAAQDVVLPENLRSTTLTSGDSEGNPTDVTPTGDATMAVIKPAQAENFQVEGFGEGGGRGQNLSSSSSSAGASGVAAVGSSGGGGSGSVSGFGGGTSGSSSSSGAGSGSSSKLLGAIGGGFSNDFGSSFDKNGSAKIVNEVTNYNAIPNSNNKGRAPSSVGAAQMGRAARLPRDADCMRDPSLARCQVGQGIKQDPLLNSRRR